MRLWSLHPHYLDSKGLVALWREGLLARAVLNQRTNGYKNHPQLDRFKSHHNPIIAIDCYLWSAYEEAEKRGFEFNLAKIGSKQRCSKIPVTEGQLDYELAYLKSKLRLRDMAQYQKIAGITRPEPHPLFKVIAGGIEPWEKIDSIK